jgi:CheY-like chemotaxis protein
MADAGGEVWWVELIKVAPGLITALFGIALVVINRKTLGALLKRMTKFKGLGIEAEFASDLDSAIASHGVAVSANDRSSALKRLDMVAPLLRDARILWIDDNPASTKKERTLLEKAGARIVTVRTSTDAERELRENEYVLVITDVKRENKPAEGLEFMQRMVREGIDRFTIAYVGTPQAGLPRPPYLFAITNRPDHLIHYVCDVIERQRL